MFEEEESDAQDDQGEEAAGTADADASLSSLSTISSLSSFYNTLLDSLPIGEGGEADDADLKALAEERDRVAARLAAVRKARAEIDEIAAELASHAEASEQLREESEQLASTQASLDALLGAIREPLSQFEELERVSGLLSGASGAVPDDEFRAALGRLDDAVRFSESHASFKDAKRHTAQFRALQERALGVVRSHVVSLLAQASRTVTAELAAEHGTLPLAGTLLAEASTFYVRFRAFAPRVRPLIEEVESRADESPDYGELLNDCRDAYTAVRCADLAPVVAANLDEPLKLGDPCRLARAGCQFFLDLTQLEWSLFTYFFSADANDATALAPLFDNLTFSLQEELRQAAIASHEVDELYALCRVLAKEVLEEQIEGAASATAALGPAVRRILQDVQERLTFVAQEYIQSDIGGYVATTEELDYPAVLETEAALALAPTPGPDAIPHTSTWFVPVHRTVVLLSKLYFAVDLSIFEGVAQEAVDECQRALVAAARTIGTTKSALDGHLFLARHVLLLRQQLSPFDVDFISTRTVLDFSHMRDAITQILSRQGGLWSLLYAAAPRVLVQRLDAKQELDGLIKATVEHFVLLVTKDLAGGLLEVEQAASAWLAAARGQAGGSLAKQQLSQQPFATVPKLQAVVAALRAAVEGPDSALQRTAARVAVYLINPGTRRALWAPVRSNTLDALGRLHRLLMARYTADEVAQVAAPNVSEIAAIFDRVVTCSATPRSTSDSSVAPPGPASSSTPPTVPADKLVSPPQSDSATTSSPHPPVAET
jgi:hypothetical protein